jgi:pimeloyl-ACP methyl ester carboxylesterase
MTGGRIDGFRGILQGLDDEPLLARVAVPTLLLCGQYDIMTPAATRAMLPRLKRGSMAVLADAGHMAQFDQPAAWRAAIGGFIAAHGG